MHCFICGLDFNIGYWEGQCCSEPIDAQESGDPVKLMDIIRTIIGNEIKCAKPTDMICTMCIVLLEQFHKYQQKLQTIRHLVLKSTYRTLKLDRPFAKIDYERKALSTFTKNKYGSYSCVQCFYKTSYADTIAPHLLYHEKGKKVQPQSTVGSLETSQTKGKETGFVSQELPFSDIKEKEIDPEPVVLLANEVEESKDRAEYETVEELLSDLTSVKEEIGLNATSQSDETISSTVIDAVVPAAELADKTIVDDMQTEDAEDIPAEYLSAEFEFDLKAEDRTSNEEDDNDCVYDLIIDAEYIESEHEQISEQFNSEQKPLLCPEEVSAAIWYHWIIKK